MCLSKTAPQENPLINNKKLRQLYLMMIERRRLTDRVVESQRGKKTKRRIDSTQGQEACSVSIAIDLGPRDLVSEAQSPALKQVAEKSGKSENRVRNRLLPWVECPGERLHVALGAAFAFKKLQQPHLVMAYVCRRDAAGSGWRHILTTAAQLELPIIFVVLPDEEGKKKNQPGTRHLSTEARSCGIPGIPVDASDAVALYRVAQESIGRIRGGGGPVVVDCVAFRTKGGMIDPIVQMKSFLLAKKVCTPAWLDHASDSVRKRVAAAEE